jgi:hypothetical protein
MHLENAENNYHLHSQLVTPKDALMFTMPAELIVRPLVGGPIPSNSTEAILERTCVEATMSQIKMCLKFISNV